MFRFPLARISFPQSVSLVPFLFCPCSFFFSCIPSLLMAFLSAFLSRSASSSHLAHCILLLLLFLLVPPPLHIFWCLLRLFAIPLLLLVLISPSVVYLSLLLRSRSLPIPPNNQSSASYLRAHSRIFDTVVLFFCFSIFALEVQRDFALFFFFPEQPSSLSLIAIVVALSSSSSSFDFAILLGPIYPRAPLFPFRQLTLHLQCRWVIYFLLYMVWITFWCPPHTHLSSG